MSTTRLSSCGVDFEADFMGRPYWVAHDGVVCCLPHTLFTQNLGTGGVMLNPRGVGGQHGLSSLAPYGYDDRLDMRREELWLNDPGDFVLFADEEPTPDLRMGSPSLWGGRRSRSVIRKIGVLQCVAAPPPDPLALRPILFGKSMPWIALQWIGSEQLWAGLPRRLDLPPATPEAMAVPRVGERACIDLLGTWYAESLAPLMQHPGYGGLFSPWVGINGLRALCERSADLRMAALRGLVQCGLDLAGTFHAGRALYPKGGHCQGRKFPVVLAGHVLGIQELLRGGYGQFAEDRTWRPDQWWRSGPQARWAFADDAGIEMDGSRLGVRPQQWLGSQDDHTTWPFAMHGYFGPVHQAMVAQVAVAKALGMHQELGQALCDSVAHYMDPNPDIVRDLQDAGLGGIEWGASTADGNWAAQCYRKIAGLLPQGAVGP